ncbi:helix-turn-helix transcriptional regulator, partial [Oceanicaulis sp. AH-315-P02]|nr:helix-turn-helix transcriptional regulator [Oceanicaulis sp. AH-315-P02]
QAQLASRIGVSVEMIGKLERGSAGASFKTIQKLCRVFNIPPNALFPSHGLSYSDDRSVLGDIIVKLSKLNEEELAWVSGLLDKAINHP